MTVGLAQDQGTPDVTVNQMVHGYLNIDVSASVDITLTDFQATYAQLELSGALTANIVVNMPDVPNITRYFNNTTGAFTVTVQPTAGTGVAISQSNRHTIGQDGSGNAYAY